MDVILICNLQDAIHRKLQSQKIHQNLSVHQVMHAFRSMHQLHDKVAFALHNKMTRTLIPLMFPEIKYVF